MTILFPKIHILYCKLKNTRKNISRKIKNTQRKISLFFDYKSQSPHRFGVWLTKSEKSLFLKTVENTKNYLEFGSGGSTFLALLKSQAQVYVVESDPDWISSMKKWKYLCRKEKEGRLIFHYADIGKVQAWGLPADEGDQSAIKKFPNYTEDIFNLIDKKTIDTVFIDGRFRVASVLSTIINCPQRPVVMIHDFWDREEYKIVLEFLDILDKADTLGVFSIKKDIDMPKVFEMYQKFKFISR